MRTALLPRPVIAVLVSCAAVLTAGTAKAEDKAALFDRVVSEALQDRALEYRGANAFLNVGLFGKPLQEVAFGRSACEDERLTHGAEDGARGRAKAAAEYAREIADRVVSSTTELPDRPGFERARAASFARILRELQDSGDMEGFDAALASPALALFLLSPAQAGYCNVVPAGSAELRVARVLEFERSGIRRLERATGDELRSTLLHLYRPKRVLDNLKSASVALALPDEEEVRARLSGYAARLAPLRWAVREGRDRLDPFTFPKGKPLVVSALDDPRNQLPPGLKYTLQMNMPIEMGSLRRELASGARRPSFSEEQWRALKLLAESCQKLSTAPDFYTLRVVTEPAATSGRFVWALGDDRVVGASIQLALLGRLAGHEPKKRQRELRRELDFYCRAIAEVR